MNPSAVFGGALEVDGNRQRPAPPACQISSVSGRILVVDERSGTLAFSRIFDDPRSALEAARAYLDPHLGITA